MRAANAAEQAKTNHIATLKSRNVDADYEASWQLGGLIASKSYDRLTEAALAKNAVNSSITRRGPTQGVRKGTT